MKKRLYMIMAVALFTGYACDDADTPQSGSQPDAIAVYPGSETVGYLGGDLKVVVASTGDWSLQGEAAWATPSATSGKNGDVVVFSVAPNSGSENINAEFTFVSGEATTTLDLVSEAVIFEVSSDREPVVSSAQSRYEMQIRTNIPAEKLTASVSKEGNGWLEFVEMQDTETGSVSLFFDVAENSKDENRSAVIVLSGEDRRIEVDFTQDRPVHITPESDRYAVGLEGGALAFSVDANVEYRIETSDWITSDGVVDGKETFRIGANESARHGYISFIYRYLTVTVDITQMEIVAEVEVELVPEKDAAWTMLSRSGWTATSNADNPMNVLDGNTKTFIYSYSDPLTLVVDMQEPRLANGIAIQYYTNSSNRYTAKNTTFYTSEDGVEWKPLGEMQVCDPLANPQYFKFSATVETRYLKAETAEAAGAIYITEFEVYQ